MINPLLNINDLNISKIIVKEQFLIYFINFVMPITATIKLITIVVNYSIVGAASFLFIFLELNFYFLIHMIEVIILLIINIIDPDLF